ncbi:hypothetical protein CTI12_AA474240 [Artemisia annua]|uniref:Uncharacterized protein n=1 Tax=Artemisia annua TaxID=35608 RepID=A0A2U1LLW1_ARTAN|nr:hypothetical protein CTI12_AA474240 [Artemisia annua]
MDINRLASNFRLMIQIRNKLWRNIFIDICNSTKVIGHIIADLKPKGANDEDWQSVDSRVKTWFYNTVKSNLLQHITDETCTAKYLWDKLEEFFTNNKMSRVLCPLQIIVKLLKIIS